MALSIVAPVAVSNGKHLSADVVVSEFSTAWSRIFPRGHDDQFD